LSGFAGEDDERCGIPSGTKPLSIRRTITVAVLGAALMASMIAVIVLMRHPSNAERNSSDLIPVTHVRFSLVRSITIRRGENVLRVARQGDGWTSGGGVTADALACESMATNLCYAYALDIVDRNPRDLATYGLEKPVLSIDMEFSDAGRIGYVFGAMTSDKSAVYFMKSGDDNLYTMLRENFARIASDSKQLVDCSLPPIDSRRIIRMEYAFNSVRETISKSDCFESGFVFDKSGIAVSSDFVARMRALTAERLDAFVAEDIKPEFGLDRDDSLRIIDGSGATLHITLGGRTDSGERYVTVLGKRGVFLARGDLVDFTSQGAAPFMDRRLVPAAPSTVANLSLSNDVTTVSLAEKDGEYYRNGARVDPADYRKALDAITGIRASGAIDDGSHGQIAYHLRIRLTNGREIRVTLRKHVRGFYALDFGKGSYLSVKTDAIDGIPELLGRR
jgi:hypothetical protein